MADSNQEQYSILVNMLDNSDYDFSHIDDIDELKIYEEKGENILDDNNNQLRVAKLNKKNNEIDRLKEREAKIGHLLQEIRKYINFHGSEPLPSPQPSPPRLVRRRRSPAHRSRSPSRIHRTPASRSRSPVRRSRSPASRSRSPVRRSRSPVRRRSGSPTFRSPTRRRNNNNPASGGKKNRTRRKRRHTKRR